MSMGTAKKLGLCQLKMSVKGYNNRKDNVLEGGITAPRRKKSRPKSSKTIPSGRANSKLLVNKPIKNAETSGLSKKPMGKQLRARLARVKKNTL